MLISEGRVKAGNLVFSHPDISTATHWSSNRDLPDRRHLTRYALALLVKYRPEELSDSGFSARVLAAQETASGLIDKAVKALGPLEIKREELSQFIMEQIRKRSQRDS